MGYTDVRDTLPLLLKGYCFLRVSYFMNKSNSVSVKNLRHWLELKTELFFAVADERNDAVVGYLFKEKPGGFV